MGYEYWSARPFNKCGGCPGSFTKKLTHKAERQIGRADIGGEVGKGLARSSAKSAKVGNDPGVSPK